MDAAGLNDLFIVTLARELHDGERVFVGANQADVALAAYLARQLWAPRLKVWAAATAQLDRGLDPLMVGRSGNDNLVVQLRGASFPQARAFEDVRGPVVFAGGFQVDARGNANLAGIRDASGGWKLRGPGSAGLASLTTLSPRFYIQVPSHDPRTLLERCSAISVLGDPTARALVGLRPEALVAVITPLATFTPTPGGLRLTGLAPGVSREVVAQRTGFAVEEMGEVSTREPLSASESATLSELRAAMDANRRGAR
jgi:acyl CoA:acetate/3-ketoacid CoA transferase beta subunit